MVELLHRLSNKKIWMILTFNKNAKILYQFSFVNHEMKNLRIYQHDLESFTNPGPTLIVCYS